VVGGAHQKFARVHAKASCGEVTPAGEVCDHRINAAVIARDRIVTGHMPGDVIREQLPNASGVATRVERALSLVQTRK
jgi:hypothetical protein